MIISVIFHYFRFNYYSSNAQHSMELPKVFLLSKILISQSYHKRKKGKDRARIHSKLCFAEIIGKWGTLFSLIFIISFNVENSQCLRLTDRSRLQSSCANAKLRCKELCAIEKINFIYPYLLHTSRCKMLEP